MKKQMNLKNILLIGSLLVFAGCSGFKQDPLADKSDAIKNAVPPSTKVEGERPITSEIVRLSVPENITFKEGKSGTLTFDVVSYLKGYNYSYEVLNITSMQGATYDSKTNTLTWNPPVGTVPAGDGHTSLDINVKIIATPGAGAAKDAPVMAGSQMVKVYVDSDITKPVITKVTPDNATFFEEGTSQYLIVTATDTAAEDKDGMRPEISFKGRLEPYAKTIARTYDATKNEWTFKVQLNLVGASITKGMEFIPLTIQVSSRLGVGSVPSSVTYTVLTKFYPAQSTFDSSTTFKVGTQKTVGFTIFDPTYKNKINVVSVKDVPNGATLTCDKTSGVFQQCFLTWNPGTFDVGNKVSKLEVQTSGTTLTDTRPAVTNIVNIYYSVSIF